MHQKITTHHAEILSLRIQRYTLSMIQLWLLEKRQLVVSLAAISRSIRKSLAEQRDHLRSVSGSDYEHYRKEADLRLQHRSYSRHLDRYSGLIHHYYNDAKLTATEILNELACQGVSTSLSSIYRILRVIREQKVEAEHLQERKSVRKGCYTSKRPKQSDVQFRAYLRAGNFPQL